MEEIKFNAEDKNSDHVNMHAFVLLHRRASGAQKCSNSIPAHKLTSYYYYYCTHSRTHCYERYKICTPKVNN